MSCLSKYIFMLFSRISSELYFFSKSVFKYLIIGQLLFYVERNVKNFIYLSRLRNIDKNVPRFFFFFFISQLFLTSFQLKVPVVLQDSKMVKIVDTSRFTFILTFLSVLLIILNFISSSFMPDKTIKSCSKPVSYTFF